MLDLSSKPLTGHNGDDYSALDRECAPLEADGRRWLGHDRFCVACKYLHVTRCNQDKANTTKASCITAVMSPLLSLTASNSKGNTKRAIVSAMFFIGYCAGCIASPQLWTERPRYFSGVVTAIVTWCLLFITLVAYRFVCMRDNAARDRVESQAGVAEGSTASPVIEGVLLDKNGLPESDLTDKEDRQFRYSY